MIQSSFDDAYFGRSQRQVDGNLIRMRFSGAAHIGSINAVISRCRLPFGLVVDEITLTGANLEAGFSPLGLKAQSTISITATVLPDDLAQLIQEKAPIPIADCKVTLDGHIYVSASVRFIVPLKASATAALRIEDGRRLIAEMQKVDVLGVDAKTLIRSQLESINPLLDLDDLGIPGQLVKADVSSGLIEVGLEAGPDFETLFQKLGIREGDKPTKPLAS